MSELVIAVKKLYDARARGDVMYLIDGLHDPLRDDVTGVAIRGMAAGFLGKLGDDRAVVPLTRMLRDVDDFARGAAAEALGEIGNRDAVPALVEMVADEREEPIRQWAIRALGRLRDASAVPVLIDALASDDTNTKWIAAEALAEIGDSRAAAPLRATIERLPLLRRTKFRRALRRVEGGR